MKTAAGSKHRSVGLGRVSIKRKDTNFCEYLNLKPALDEFSDGSSPVGSKKGYMALFSFVSLFLFCNIVITLKQRTRVLEMTQLI